MYNMGFIESYKHLEKLCGEVLNDDRRISAYIDKMINTPRGSYPVSYTHLTLPTKHPV